jgi:tetratricopeptide (TPR) repeat protein
MGPDQRDLITSHTILLKGQAYFELKRPEEGLAVFEELRARFPESDPAVLSHLIEARYYAAVNNLVLAQQRLRRLTDTYPESRYAPLALWEAALFAAYRDDLSSDSGALKLLEELVTSYPSHELVYFARLKQADHLRSKIEFGAAQLIYEDLINNYPQHPERYRAELSRADCHFAQAGQNASRLGDAIAIFQRLVDLPHLPVDLRVESGFKWGNAEAKSQGRGRAQDVFMLILNRFLRDSEMASQLGVQGRYWMARMIFKFGELLEEEALYEDALSVYSMIETYGLPGEALLKNKLRDLSVPR